MIIHRDNGGLFSVLTEAAPLGPIQKLACLRQWMHDMIDHATPAPHGMSETIPILLSHENAGTA